MERVLVTPCLYRQLDRLHTLASQEGAEPHSAPLATFSDRRPVVYVHPTRSWASTSWAVAIADNAPFHMAPDQGVFYQVHSGPPNGRRNRRSAN